VIESDSIANFEWLKMIQLRISSYWKWFLNSACVVCCCLAYLDAAQGGRWERKTPTLFIYKICPFRLSLFLFWYPSPSTRRKAACQELHRKSQSLDHLPHETLHVRNAANRLCLRRSSRPFLENFTNQDYSPAPVSSSLKPYISSFTNFAPGCHMPRRAWVQFNRLRTGHGRLNADLCRMGLDDYKNCVCGNIQYASHIPCHCTVMTLPRSITNTTNEDLNCISSQFFLFDLTA